jgi:hypothetical protein
LRQKNGAQGILLETIILLDSWTSFSHFSHRAERTGGILPPQHHLPGQAAAGCRRYDAAQIQ